MYCSLENVQKLPVLLTTVFPFPQETETDSSCSFNLTTAIRLLPLIPSDVFRCFQKKKEKKRLVGCLRSVVTNVNRKKFDDSERFLLLLTSYESRCIADCANTVLFKTFGLVFAENINYKSLKTNTVSIF